MSGRVGKLDLVGEVKADDDALGIYDRHLQDHLAPEDRGDLGQRRALRDRAWMAVHDVTGGRIQRRAAQDSPTDVAVGDRANQPEPLIDDQGDLATARLDAGNRIGELMRLTQTDRFQRVGVHHVLKLTISPQVFP